MKTPTPIFVWGLGFLHQVPFSKTLSFQILALKKVHSWEKQLL